MQVVELRGRVDATLRSQMEEAVRSYGAANTGVSHADDVRLQLVGPDGKPCEVEGTFQRDPMGTLVFIALGIVGQFVKGAVERLFKREGRGPNARRAARKDGSKRQAALASLYGGGLPSDPEERLAFLLSNELLKKEKGGAFRMQGGRLFKNKAEVLAHLAELPATESGGGEGKPDGGTPAVKAEGGKKAPATKAVKKAAKAATKAAAKVAKKAAKKRK
jgi:hypothetical protein